MAAPRPLRLTPEWDDRFAGMVDPLGASFSVMQPAASADAILRQGRAKGFQPWLALAFDGRAAAIVSTRRPCLRVKAVKISCL